MKIQIISHIIHAEEVRKIAHVCQEYADLVCARHELARAEITYVEGAKEPAPGFLAIGIFSTPDVADALGYHDVDPRGMPYGKAFLSVIPGKTLLHDPSGHGASLAAVVTHELAEMLGDRFANLWAYGTIVDPRHPRRKFGSVAYELADPVQDNAFTMPALDGTPVDCSDFVLPSFFNPGTLATEQTSYLGGTRGATGPFKCAPGGYLIVGQESGQTQVFGKRIGAKHERVFDAEVDPPEWREEIRLLKNSRSSRRRR